MIRPTLGRIPRVALPPGYRLRAYRPGDAAVWVRIQREADRYNAVTLATFRREFRGSEALRARRILFALDASGCPVGTIAAWFGAAGPTGAEGVLHWLAVRPSEQGKGLGRALTLAVLRRLARFHRFATLETDARRHAAIRLYASVGFRPRVGGRAPGGRGDGPAVRVWAGRSGRRRGRTRPRR